MTLGKFVQLWIGLLLVALVLTLVFMQPARLAQVISKEVELARATLGTADTDKVLVATNAWHRGVFSEAALAERERAKQAQGAVSQVSAGLDRFVDAAADRMRYLLYLALFRIQWLLQGAVPILVFIVAAAIDGLVVRRRRAFSFAYTSTAIYNASSYFVLIAGFVPLFYLIAPMVAPPVLLPIAGVGIAGAVWIFFAYLPGAAPMIGMTT